MTTPNDEPVTEGDVSRHAADDAVEPREAPPSAERRLSEAEAAHLAARETVALDLSRPAGPRRRPSDGEAPSIERPRIVERAGFPVGHAAVDVAGLPTVQLPRQRPSGTTLKRGIPLVVAATVAALVNTGWAALICIAPLLGMVALVPLTAGQQAGAHSIPYALAGWLLAHGVPLQTSIGPIGLAPLSLTMLAVWRVNRAGVHTTRAIGARGSGSLPYALIAAGAVGLAYGGLGLLAAMVVDRPGLATEPWRALISFAVVGAVAAFAGSIRATGALRQLARTTPLVIRDGIRTGSVSALLLIGLGAAACGLSIALAGGEASDFLAAYRTGLAGQAGLTLLCLALAPNFAVWATSYLLGPGFMVGADTAVRANEVNVGKLPLLPAFAGLPDTPLPAAGWLLLAIPLLAGAAASALLVWRRLRPRQTRSGDTVLPAANWQRLFGAAVLAGPVAGALIALAAFISGGSLGDGRLSAFGPSVAVTALVAAGIVSLGAVLGVAAAAVDQRRRASG